MEEEGEWLTTMQIMNYLQTKTKDEIALNKVATFGRTLQKLKISCKRSMRGTQYYLKRVE